MELAKCSINFRCLNHFNITEREVIMRFVFLMSFLILFGSGGVRAVDLHSEADKEKNEIADSIIDRSYDSESDMPDKKNHFRILWGPKAGVGFFVPEKWTNTENHDGRLPGFGCAAGMTARFEWNSRWYVEPALMLAYGNSSVPVYFRRAEETPRYGGDYHMSRGGCPGTGSPRFQVQSSE